MGLRRSANTEAPQIFRPSLAGAVVCRWCERSQPIAGLRPVRAAEGSQRQSLGLERRRFLDTRAGAERMIAFVPPHGRSGTSG